MARRGLALALVACGVALSAGCGTSSASTSRTTTSAAPPPSIHHVFIIVLENESASTTFGSGSPAPYLSKTLTAEGAYLPKYYGIGHESNDNYIAMISGQAPNPQTQGDCQFFDDFTPGTIAADGQAVGQGCVFPAAVPTIASQLTAAGFTWRDYNESMGADPSRESATCGHPAVGARDNTESAEAKDMYATRHNPFVYFHSIIDDTTLCDTHVVNLDQLPADLTSAGRTANYTFITPNLCDDGHDAPCADGEPGGLRQVDKFLQTWVPRITGSPAFRQDGLLMVIFDEAASSDTSSCCQESPGPNSPSPGIGGPGGGVTGAVLLSPCIAPGTVSQTPYNHYTMLGSVENLFGLKHLGYAGLPGETYFGSDVFNRSCAESTAPPGTGSGGGGPGVTAPVVTMSAPAIASQGSAWPLIGVSWRASVPGALVPATYAVQMRDLSVRGGRWRSLWQHMRGTLLTYSGALGHTYVVRVRANEGGTLSRWASAQTIVPTGVHPAGSRFSPGWKVVRRRGAWRGQAIQTIRPGASLTLRYTGGALTVVGETTARGGVMRVTLDGRTHTVRLHSASLRRRRLLFTARVRRGAHRLRIADVRGLVALEGLAIAGRTR